MPDSNMPSSSYPESREEWVMLTCPKCDHQWEERMIEELGAWSFENGQDCPKCGTEGKYE